MSDNRENCVCGCCSQVESKEVDLDEILYFVECESCNCSTAFYDTEAEAVTSWNKMQRAFKSGWSSEVPTEEGHYMLAHLRRIKGEILYGITGHIEIKKENGRLYTEQYEKYVKSFGDFAHEEIELKKRFLDERPLPCGYIYLKLCVADLPPFIPDPPKD